MRVIKSRRMSWAGHVARKGEEKGVYRFLVGKREGRRQLGRPRRRWVDNIRMDLQEVGCGYYKHNKVISHIYLILFFSYQDDARSNTHQIYNVVVSYLVIFI